MKLKKGDTVKVLIGKDAGRTGRILKVMPKNDEVIVDGLNLFKKHTKGDNRLKQSAIIDISKPLHISNIMLVCPACSKPSRLAMKNVDGKTVRVCKRCGKAVEAKKTVEKTEKPKTDSKKESKETKTKTIKK